MRARWRWAGVAFTVVLVLGIAVVAWAHRSGWLFLMGIGSRGELEIRSGSSVSLPVVVDRGLVFVPAVVGSKHVELLLDSGFQFTVVNADRAGELNVAIAGWRDIPSGGGSVRLGFAPRLPIGLSGARFEPRRLPALHLGFLEPYVGRRLYGILGHDFISLAAIEIDYDSELVRLHEPVAYEPLGDAVALSVEIDHREVRVAAELDPLGGNPVGAKLKVDTGSVSGLGLNGTFVARSGLVGSKQPAVSTPGVGVRGPTESRAFRLDALTLGPFTLSRPVARYTPTATGGDEDAGTLGGEVLQRFTVTLDYHRKRMLLKPGSRVSAPFPFDHTGLSLVAEGDDLRQIAVRHVVPGSPADEAGAQAGDRVVSLRGRAARGLTLGEAENLLSSTVPLLELEIERSGEIHELTLEPRVLLP